MILVKYRQYHLPELCKCEYHRNKVFVDSEGQFECGTPREALEHIIKINTQIECYQYAVIEVTQTR